MGCPSLEPGRKLVLTIHYFILPFFTVYYFYYCLLLSITLYYFYYLLLPFITFYYFSLLFITSYYLLLPSAFLGCPAHPLGLSSPPFWGLSSPF